MAILQTINKLIDHDHNMIFSIIDLINNNKCKTTKSNP